jgi:hypothetical protein
MTYFICFNDNNQVVYTSTQKDMVKDWENDPKFVVKPYIEITEEEAETTDPDSLLYGIKDNNVTKMTYGNINTISDSKIGTKNMISFIDYGNQGYNIELAFLKAA